MGRKVGTLSVSKPDAQLKVLALLEQGATITNAMAAVSRQDTAFRQWVMQDADFKEKSDKARLAGKGVKVDLAELKAISYPDFSTQFLDTTLFDHQLNWLDLIEGVEPRWQPSGMTYEPGDPKRVLINVPPEHCATLDTPIFTGNRGWTTVGDVTQDDTLIAPNGLATEILSTWRPEEEVDIYAVKFSDGEVIKTDGGHKWNVYPVYASHKKRAELVEITTTQLIGESGNFKIPVSNGWTHGSDVELPIDPYLFGYWLGDGGYDRASFTIGLEDIDAFESEVSNLGFTTKVRLDSRSKTCYQVYVHKLRSSLVLTGEFENIDRSIPTQYFLGSRNQRVALLQGLMDADGTITAKDSRARFVQHKERMARDVYRLAASLGLKPHLKHYGQAWEVGFRTTDFNVFRLERKFSRQKTANLRGKSKSRVIVSVTPAGKAMVQCMTVLSDTNEYLIGEGLIQTRNAKSTTITTNYVLYTIVTNPNARVIIVSKTQGMARKFLGAIKTRLSHPAYTKLQTAFGPNGGYKADATQWSADMIYLGTGRDSGEKDPTVQALGFGSQIYGARADLIILDDVVMNSNAHEWEKQIEWLQKEVITRLGRHGKLLIVGTRVAPIDLYKMIRDGAQWTGGKTPFTYCAMPAVLAFDENPEKWVTLWPKTNMQENEIDEQFEDGLYPKWDGPSLFKRRSEVAPSIWAMVYQQEDVQSDSIFAPACIAGSVNGMRRRGLLKEGVPGHPKNTDSLYTIIGLDPAMVGATGAVVASYNRADGKIYVLDCINMIDPNPMKIQALIEDWVEKYKPQELRIEINAHQKAYALDDNLRNYLASYGCQLNSHFTGKNKWDVGFGVASMASLFGTTRDGRFQDNNIIELPSNEGSEGLKTLVQELITWKPDTRNPTDCVMALWFTIIRFRELMQSSSKVGRYQTNRWATRAQVSGRSGINLDEAFAAQWQETYS